MCLVTIGFSENRVYLHDLSFFLFDLTKNFIPNPVYSRFPTYFP